MIRYHVEQFDIDKLSRNNIDRIQIGMIPENSKILEIGCATGYMSEYLTKKMGCQVTGVEVDIQQAEVAREKCHELIIDKIDSIDTQKRLDQLVSEQGKFDVVFMSQVIEHLAYPEEVLSDIHRWIGPEGVLVISTCNIAHWRCRMRLLIGKWDYEEYGVFDRTHLRFFTTRSLKKMLEDRGFKVLEEGYSVEDFCPFRLLFGIKIIAPSVILPCVPFIGMALRKRYIYLFRNIISTQFVYKASLS